MKGLVNKSRIGQAHPETLSPETIQQIIEFRKGSNVGAYIIKDALGLTYSIKNYL